MLAPSHTDNTYGSLHRHLGSFRQLHVLRWWQELTPQQRKHLQRQVNRINLKQVRRLFQQTVSEGHAVGLPAAGDIHPAPVIRLPASDEQRAQQFSQAAQRGAQALEAGEVGIVLVAGGQGSRLGFDGPKGTFQIGAVSGKSLFQIHAEKVLALSRRYGVSIPLYVMTGPDNDDTTREYFASNDWFGLEFEQVTFFQQGTMPAVDRNTGELLLGDKHHLATSPNGHGGVLQALADEGHLDDLRRRGIQYLFYYQVDNPLVKVADPEYLGLHIESGAEMSLKVVPKLYSQEKLGVVVEVGGRLQIIEYSDLPQELAERQDAGGGLEFWAGSIPIHVFNVSFLHRLAANGSLLPFHRAIKTVPYVDELGQRIAPDEPNAIKFEMFVFDALPLAHKALVVEASRGEEFEPLKNADGENSPASVQRAMSNLFAEWLNRAGIDVPRCADGSAAVPVEIGPLFAADAAELCQRQPPPMPITAPLLLDAPPAQVLQ